MCTSDFITIWNLSSSLFCLLLVIIIWRGQKRKTIELSEKTCEMEIILPGDFWHLFSGERISSFSRFIKMTTSLWRFWTQAILQNYVEQSRIWNVSRFEFKSMNLKLVSFVHSPHSSKISTFPTIYQINS